MARPDDKVALVKGQRYRGTIELTWLESFASNQTVADKFGEYGFTNVTVTGSGYTRVAEGTWSEPDMTIDRPAQVKQLEVIEA